MCFLLLDRSVCFSDGRSKRISCGEEPPPHADAPAPHRRDRPRPKGLCLRRRGPGTPRSDLSAALLVRQIRPSSRNRVRQRRTRELVPPDRCGCHSRRRAALFHDPHLLGVRPTTSPTGVRGRKNLYLRYEPMLCHSFTLLQAAGLVRQTALGGCSRRKSVASLIIVSITGTSRQDLNRMRTAVRKSATVAAG